MPKVVTQRCLEQDSNPRPTDRKPKCLTVAPPRHPFDQYTWINVLDPSLTRAILEHLRDEQLIIKRFTDKASFTFYSARNYAADVIART